MATINEITHDSSTVLADFYDSTTDPDGAVTVSPTAALGGSTNGLLIDHDAGSGSVELIDDITPTTPAGIRLRCRVDLDGASHPGTGNSVVLVGMENAAGSSIRAYIEVESDGVSGFDVTYDWGQDAGPSNSGPYVLPSGEICLELRLVRETADGNEDGEAEGFINGVSQFSLSNLQNFNQFDFGRLAVYADGNTGITGSSKADEFLLTDVPGTALCPATFSGYNLVLGGGQV